MGLPTEKLLPILYPGKEKITEEERREIRARYRIRKRQAIRKIIEQKYVWLVGPYAGDHGGTIRVPIEESWDIGEGEDPRFAISYRNPDDDKFPIVQSEYRYLWSWAEDEETALESAKKQRISDLMLQIRRERKRLEQIQSELDKLTEDLETTIKSLQPPTTE